LPLSAQFLLCKVHIVTAEFALKRSHLPECCKKIKAVLAACTLSLFTLHPVWADDTEIYFNSVHGSSVKPNLLFILDASLSMNWFDCANGKIVKNDIGCQDNTNNGTVTRLDRMIAALQDVFGRLGSDHNVGLMRFDGADGGRVIYPVSDLAIPGVREGLAFALDDIETVVGTPTVGALEEAWRYYGGHEVKHGLIRAHEGINDNWNNLKSLAKSRVSHPGSYSGGIRVGLLDGCEDTNLSDVNCENEMIVPAVEGEPVVYDSPIESECQSNYTIVLSDGNPWTGPAGNRRALPQYFETVALAETLNDGNACENTDRIAELCGEEFASVMLNGDVRDTLAGDQTITTYTVGFNRDSDWMRAVATAGGGDYLTAESSADLISAIDNITSQVSESGTTVVAPTVTVDQFSRLAHRKESYLALFKPQATANGVGNLKKYNFSGADPTLKDQNGDNAIDGATGEFIPGSQSFWSASPDGADVVRGGAASILNPATRRIVSNLDVDTDSSLLAAALPVNNPNEIHEDNTLLTDALLGLSNAPGGAAAGAGEVCFFENEDWVWANTTGPDFRFCTSVIGNSNFLAGTNHRNTISAISVGTGVHTIFYEFFGGNGKSLCVSSNTDNHSLGAMNDTARSYVVGTGECPGVESSASPPKRDELISWLKGVDVNDEDDDQDFTEARNHIGDPLHSSPVVVSYGAEDGETLDKDNLNELVFFGTNEGFLHAINTNDGTEEYAFMPRELLSNLPRLFANAPLARTEIKPYGLDGDITLRTIDNNNNGLIESDEGDKAYLYVGMRRGGRNYYALDVSDKEQPKFLWSIIGGSGDYAELGESWSKPIVTKVQLNDTSKDVLVFAGGYHASQDNKDVRKADTHGRAIFIVDADTGELVWSAGPSENQLAFSSKHFAFDGMDYSIPADLAIVPDQQTGLLSQMYVGDMGGQLWRFDINNGSSIADLVDGGIIANFAEDSVAGTRRFYGTPDLSLSRDDNGQLTINIAIGSGYRAHPLNMNIDDKFFLYRYPFAGRSDIDGDNTYEAATLDDLFDTTDNTIGQGSDEAREQARSDIADAQGWFITMVDAGEKILDRASTFDGVVRFISYVPSVPVGPCDPSLGNSFFYAVNLADGTPFEDINEDNNDNDINTYEKEFRRHELPGSGIAPPVSTIFVENEGDITPTDVSGVNTIHEWDNTQLIRRWFWAENPD